MSFSREGFWLVFCAFSAVLCFVPGCGCYQEVSDDTLMYGHIKPQAGPYAINGLRPGMSRADCLRTLGEPDQKSPANFTDCFWTWTSRHQVTVVFQNKTDGPVVDVNGDRLTDISGNTLLSRGSNEQEIRATLPHASSKKHYGPSGSGVISLGMSHRGTTYSFNDDKGSFELIVSKEGQVTGLLVRKPK